MGAKLSAWLAKELAIFFGRTQRDARWWASAWLAFLAACIARLAGVPLYVPHQPDCVDITAGSFFLALNLLRLFEAPQLDITINAEIDRGH